MKQKQQERLATPEGQIWRSNLIERMGLENKYKGKKLLHVESGEIFDSPKAYKIRFRLKHIKEIHELVILNKIQVI